jgi:hypothetical protein
MIDSDKKWWNMALITEIFTQEEAEIICKIPLSRYGQQDVMCWRGTSTGEFTVRSAYHMDKEHKVRDRGESSKAYRHSRIWKAIWSLKVANSIKMFLWRACHDLLPTRRI